MLRCMHVIFACCTLVFEPAEVTLGCGERQAVDKRSMPWQPARKAAQLLQRCMCVQHNCSVANPTLLHCIPPASACFSSSTHDLRVCGERSVLQGNLHGHELPCCVLSSLQTASTQQQ
jgi:hypothetical protein